MLRWNGYNWRRSLLPVMLLEREKIPVYLSSFVKIRVEIDLGCLDRGVPEILLHDPEVLGTAV